MAYIPTHTNFLLVNLGTKAENVYQKLLREGVIIRSMASYGLDNYVRVTIGLPEENERFIRSLKKVLQPINKA